MILAPPWLIKAHAFFFPWLLAIRLPHASDLRCCSKFTRPHHELGEMGASSTQTIDDDLASLFETATTSCRSHTDLTTFGIDD